MYILWGTKTIVVLKSDMTLIQSNPYSLYELDLDWFRLQLKGFEWSEEGMLFPDTHVHTAPITVGGALLARVVELINEYHVQFEDDQYAVNLVGANSNVADVVDLNLVSVRSANSAGLIIAETGTSGLTPAESNALLTIQSDVDQVADDIVSIDDNIYLIEDSVDDIENDIGQIGLDVGSIEGNISQIGTDITGINNDIGDIDSNIVLIQSDVSEIKGNIALIDTSISSIEAGIAVIEVDVSNISSGVVSIDTNIGLITASISNMETALEFIRAIEAGEWRIEGSQMIFFDESSTEIARFDLFDVNGNPSPENPHRRVPV